MRAMVFEAPASPLVARTLPLPRPGPEQLLIRVHACGVCRTDLHIMAGELPPPRFPLIPGHEIVGEVVTAGQNVNSFRPGNRVGVPWLGQTCGHCSFCRGGRENLCDQAQFTGYHLDGGYAEYTLADARYCLHIPDAYDDVEAAPLLCAGLIGYRAYRLAGEGKRLGLYGFGAAAHLLCQLAVHQGKEIYAFTRPGDTAGQRFARQLGAVWAGGSDETPPQPLDAALIFAPVGALVPAALRAVDKGGCVVCAGIHMSDIPGFPYRILWQERTVRSVANLTRADGTAFLSLAPGIPVRTAVRIYPLTCANEALEDLHGGKIKGAAVLKMHPA